MPSCALPGVERVPRHGMLDHRQARVVWANGVALWGYGLEGLGCLAGEVGCTHPALIVRAGGVAVARQPPVWTEGVLKCRRDRSRTGPRRGRRLPGRAWLHAREGPVVRFTGHRVGRPSFLGWPIIGTDIGAQWLSERATPSLAASHGMACRNWLLCRLPFIRAARSPAPAAIAAIMTVSSGPSAGTIRRPERSSCASLAMRFNLPFGPQSTGTISPAAPAATAPRQRIGAARIDNAGQHGVDRLAAVKQTASRCLAISQVWRVTGAGTSRLAAASSSKVLSTSCAITPTPRRTRSCGLALSGTSKFEPASGCPLMIGFAARHRCRARRVPMCIGASPDNPMIGGFFAEGQA